MRQVTWEQVSLLCQKLAQDLEQCQKDFTGIYAVPRGGLPVGVHLSHLMGIRMKFDSYNPGDLQYITVDDINDTGRTMRPHVADPLCTTVALFERLDAEVKADFVGEYVDHNDWLIFPWESKERASSDMNKYSKEREENAVYQSRE